MLLRCSCGGLKRPSASRFSASKLNSHLFFFFFFPPRAPVNLLIHPESRERLRIAGLIPEQLNTQGREIVEGERWKTPMKGKKEKGGWDHLWDPGGATAAPGVAAGIRHQLIIIMSQKDL